MKHTLAEEGKRMDIVLQHLDQPKKLVTLAPETVVRKKKPVTSDIVNDYVDLYKNFSEFNAENNPIRQTELKVGINQPEYRPLPQ